MTAAPSSAGVLAGANKSKPGARAVLFGLEPGTADIIRDCFRQFQVETVVEDDCSGQRLEREKFEACVVALDDPRAGGLIEFARKSRSNQRILIYGLASSTLQALSYAKHGVNALIPVPINRAAALKVVRASHLLVVNELRRYARVPMVISVGVETEQRNFDVATVEVSAGGMSVRTDRSLLLNSALALSFTLPPGTAIKVRGSVAWVNAQEQRAGIRFDAGDARRSTVKAWVDNYLQAV
jgi:PilZ domain-containing protein